MSYPKVLTFPESVPGLRDSLPFPRDFRLRPSVVSSLRMECKVEAYPGPRSLVNEPTGLTSL